jgi:hypothetical protein
MEINNIIKILLMEPEITFPKSYSYQRNYELDEIFDSKSQLHVDNKSDEIEVLRKYQVNKHIIC